LNIPETGQETERPAREQDRQVRCQADDMLLKHVRRWIA